MKMKNNQAYIFVIILMIVLLVGFWFLGVGNKVTGKNVLDIPEGCVIYFVSNHVLPWPDPCLPEGECVWQGNWASCVSIDSESCTTETCAELNVEEKESCINGEGCSINTISRVEFKDFLKEELNNYFENKLSLLPKDELKIAFYFYFEIVGEEIDLSQSELSQDSIKIIEDRMYKNEK